jgi:hypothetical protein
MILDNYSNNKKLFQQNLKQYKPKLTSHKRLLDNTINMDADYGGGEKKKREKEL